MNKRLPRSTPEVQRIPSFSVLAFLAEAEKSIDHLHSVMLLQHGQVVAEGSIEELRSLIPAAELAVVESDDTAAVRRRAEGRGLTCRDAGSRVTVWLPRKAELEEVAGYFRGIPLASLTLKPVGLEEVYAETVKG